MTGVQTCALPICTCKRLIERGQTAGLAEKIDIFYALGRITEAEYKELTELLAEKTGA